MNAQSGSKTLSARSSLETLRKEAKRWLKALRDGDASARERLRAAYPGASASPSLRDVQHALAREYGLEGWAALQSELSALALAAHGRERLLAEFLEHACIHYGIRPDTSVWDRAYRDDPARWSYAARILAKHPEIVHGSLHAAAVSGDVAEVERILSESRLRERPGKQRPGKEQAGEKQTGEKQQSVVRERGGPQAWEPLLFVCYGRLPLPQAGTNAVPIARLLIDAGADVHAPLNAENELFCALTGAIGGGEFSQPAHPQAVELAELLIERGADPYDPQALYNTSLEGDDVFWLDFLYEHSARRNETHKWTDESSQWPESGMLDYLLGNAVSRNAVERTGWLLAHGADPNARHYYSKRKLHTEALLLGFSGMAQLLRTAGAEPEELRGHDEFLAACARQDLDAVVRLVREYPQFLHDATVLLRAAERDLADVAALLLDLGMSPDAADEAGCTALHMAAISNAVQVGRLLIQRGAKIDPQESRFHGTPLDWALFGSASGMIAVLGAFSRSPKSLVAMGDLQRLRVLFAEDASLAGTVDRNGSLFAYLPADEGQAFEVAELLLEYGADPLATNGDGLNAAELLAKRGLEDVAEWLKA